MPVGRLQRCGEQREGDLRWVHRNQHPPARFQQPRQPRDDASPVVDVM